MKTALSNIIRNKITKILTIAIIATFVFNACMKEVEFDEGVLDSKLVVNGFVCADSIVKIQLAISKPIPGIEKSTEWVDDASIKLFVDGEFAEELQNFEITYEEENGYNDYYYYSNNQKPTTEYRSVQTTAQIGKTYKIEVEHPDFDKVWAETTIPEAVAIDSVRNEMKEVTEYGYTETRQFIRVKFTDPEEIENYYRLVYSLVTGRRDNYYWNDKTGEYEYVDSIKIVHVSSETDRYFSTNDPLLVGEDDADDFLFMGAGNDYNLFTDDLIKGQTYELSFNNYYYDHNHEMQEGEFYKNSIQLMSLSKEAFLYIKSSYEHWWYDEEFLTEPVQVYTNINNGLGIFAGYSIDEYSIMQGEYPVDSMEYVYHN